MSGLSVEDSPLERGLRGVLRWGARFGMRCFATVWRCGISWLRVTALILGGYAWASHTPGPSWEGRFWMLIFLLVMSGLWYGGFPLLRGDQGVCYGEGCGMGGGVSKPIWVLNPGINPFVQRKAFLSSYCNIIPLGTQYEYCLYNLKVLFSLILTPIIFDLHATASSNPAHSESSKNVFAWIKISLG